MANPVVHWEIAVNRFNPFRSSGSNFSAYYAKLARDGITGIPTADEAKKDYREFIRGLSRSPCS